MGIAFTSEAESSEAYYVQVHPVPQCEDVPHTAPVGPAREELIPKLQRPEGSNRQAPPPGKLFTNQYNISPVTIMFTRTYSGSTRFCCIQRDRTKIAQTLLQFTRPD